jgi:hypothetical protein
MKGDFTRNTFDSEKHFLRVLLQQGRVQLDSDWNEQASILLHYLQTLAADLIGPYAGPEANRGFEVSNGSNGDFTIGKGRYYVNGILCENEQESSYLSQADFPLTENDALVDGNYIAYLDVWERHISFVEDDDIREKALKGVDTATRSKVIWQVKVMPLTFQYAYCQQGSSLLTDNLLVLSQVCMSARAKQGQPATQPCLTEPGAQYRGAENQLYRVEIHNGNFDDNGQAITPAFKFSRENGTVIFPVRNISFDAASATTLVELEHLGCDDKLGLAVNDWVEYIDDGIDLLDNKFMPLAQVHVIDAINRKVTLSGAFTVDNDYLSKHPLLRRWDQKNANNVNAQGVMTLTTDNWIKLEDGIEVKFSIEDGGRVRRGDYWLIPARQLTGDVEWPKVTDNKGNLIPKALSPMGTLHYYAPLAIINENGEGRVSVLSDCRCSFRPLSYTCAYNYFGRLGIGTDLICPQDEKVDQ